MIELVVLFALIYFIVGALAAMLEGSCPETGWLSVITAFFLWPIYVLYGVLSAWDFFNRRKR